MPQDQEPTPSQTITVDLPGIGIRGFPSLEAARAAAKAAAEDRSFQVQGEGFSISRALKQLLTPEAAGLAGFAVGGPVGAGAAATGMSLARDVAQGESPDPFAAGEHALINAAPGALAGAAGRLPSAMAGASGSSTGGAIIKALGEILGGHGVSTAEEMRVGGALTRRGPALGKGSPLLADATRSKVGQLAVDAENALAGTGKIAIRGGAKADLSRRARQLTEAFDELGRLRRTTGGTLPPEIAAILKANGLNPKTVQDLLHQRIALGGHAALAGGAGSLE